MSIRARRIRDTLLLAAGAVFATALLAELGLRVVRPIPFSEDVEYIADAHVGMRLAPGRAYKLKNGGRCSVNAQGFRGTRDIARVAPAGTTRVVALGESSTFCYQNDDAHTWCALLEAKLRERYGHDVEVINAGVPGYCSFDSKINYMYRIRPLHPDVVLVYHTWNDLKNFKFLEEGNVIERKPYWPTWRRNLKGLARHSQIARRVRAFLNEVVYPNRRENTYASTDPGTTIAANGPAHAWERQNFNDLAALFAEDNVPAVFATQAGLVTESTVEDPEIRRVLYVEYASMTFGEVRDEWDAVSDIIRDVASRRGICIADVRARVPADLDHFVDHVHLTDLGNEVVANAMFDAIVACPRIDSVFQRTHISEVEK